MDKKQIKKRNIITKIFGNQKLIAILMSLFLAFGIWFFLTLTKFHSVVFTYKLEFVDKYNPRSVFQSSESFINIKTQANGFDIIMHNNLKNDNIICIDINDVNVKKNKSLIRINTNSIKHIIAKHIKSSPSSFSIEPDQINIRHTRLIRKRVKVVNKTNFNYKNSYYPLNEPRILSKIIIIEGLPIEVDRIDSVYTQDIIIENIDRKNVFFIPLVDLRDSLGINYNFSSALIQVNPVQFTEISKEIKINTYNDDFDSIILFPPKANLTYRLPVMDYNKIDSIGINLGIEKKIKGKNKLKIIIDTPKSNIKIINIEPSEVEYLIFKK